MFLQNILEYTKMVMIRVSAIYGNRGEGLDINKMIRTHCGRAIGRESEETIEREQFFFHNINFI